MTVARHDDDDDDDIYNLCFSRYTTNLSITPPNSFMNSPNTQNYLEVTQGDF